MTSTLVFRAAGMVALAAFGVITAPLAAFAAAQGPFEVPVLVLSYFPTNGDLVDVRVTGDWGRPLAETRAKTQRQTREVLNALEQGSRYHGYKDAAAKPSLKYSVVGEMEFLRPLPTFAKPGHRTPMTDYARIMADVNIRDWVERRGVREVWIWGYHGGKVDLWESNMSSPSGDVSNSDRDPKDLPVLDRTYTVYHYNYQRGTSEAVEDHLHQIEAVLNAIDGRDRTPAGQWTNLLFWGKFVGSDRSHKIVRPGCGWAHYPPNAEKDYDWANRRYVETDIEDWEPDGTGRKQRMNCERWSGNSLKWFVYWMQNLPGMDNGLSYQGKPLRNWWVFLGDYDTAKRQGMKLVAE
ncbi:MAG: hypothetical protein HZA90_05375 [Verrucomicrobia bacterium]|nr:hypothetical protein [Verrucomicrobiota bacterium]